jgi:TetR/AcrR family transcriptional regulator, transcriptional repressor for nem operon
MGHSQEDKAASRAKIVAAAAHRIRESGLSGFSIADVMKDADLTHGGFYVHFDSRDELIAAALDQALRESKVVYEDDSPLSLKQIVTQYLSRAHRDAPTAGCAVVAVASEISRSDGEARTVMDAHLKRYFQKISASLDGSSDHELAIPIVCMLNGALTLSRLLDDKIISDKVLKETRDFILALTADNAAPTQSKLPSKAPKKPARPAGRH